MIVISEDDIIENEEIIIDESVPIADIHAQIHNLLFSSNNKNKSYKSPAYWQRKINSILEIENEPIKSVNDSNVKPLIVKTKCTGLIDVEFRKARNEILSKFTSLFPKKNTYYSKLAEEQQYRKLCPFEQTGHDQVDRDTDTFAITSSKNLYTTRMLAPSEVYDGDLFEEKGKMILYNNDNINKFHSFNATKYIDSLKKLKNGDHVVIVNDQDVLKGVVEHIDDVFIGISAKDKKLRYLWSMNNVFMVYTPKFEPKLPKSFFYSENIAIIGLEDDLTFVPGDTILLDKNVPKMFYDDLLTTYPCLNNNVKSNTSWVKYYTDAFVEPVEINEQPIKKYTNAKSTWYSSYKQQKKWISRNVMNLNNDRVDDLYLVQNISFESKKNKKVSSNSSSRSSSPSRSGSRKSDVVLKPHFHSVEESQEHVPKKFDPFARAALVLSVDTFIRKIKDKKEKKVMDHIFPNKYRIFSLKHVLINDVIKWDIDQDITAEYVHIKTVNNNIVDDISCLNKKTIDKYVEIAEYQNSVNYKYIKPIFEHDTHKSYTDYSGLDHGQQDEFVVAFEQHMEQMDDNEIDTENTRNMNQYPHYALLECIMNWCDGIKLSKQHQKMILVSLSPGKETGHMWTNFLIIFSMIIIFVQIELPRKICKYNVNVLSFPMVHENYEFVDFMSKLMYTIIDSEPTYEFIKTKKVVQFIKENSNESLLKAIKNILIKKSSLQVLLEYSRSVMKIDHIGTDVSPNISPKSQEHEQGYNPAWKPTIDVPYLENIVNKMTENIKINTNVNFYESEKQRAKKKKQVFEKKHVPLSILKNTVPVKEKVVKRKNDEYIKQNSPNLIEIHKNDNVQFKLDNAISYIIKNNKHFKNDEIFQNLFLLTKNDEMWNKMSEFIEQELKIFNDPKLNDIYLTIDDRVLIKFITFELKTLLGKYVNNYLYKKEELTNERIILEKLAKQKNVDTVQQVKSIIENMINFTDFMINPPSTDFKHVLFYIFIVVLLEIEKIFKSRTKSELYNYIIDQLTQRIILTNNVRESYEKGREVRKIKMQDFYASLDHDTRRTFRNNIKMGLENIDDIMAKVNNAREDFDRDAAEE
jgi:hypothetical protein